MRNAIWRRLTSSPFSRRIGWNIFGTAAGRLFGPIAQIIVARYLDPTQFGLFALGMAWIAFFDVIKDLGLNHAIIVDQTTRDRVPVQFAVELSLAFALFSVSLIVAPYFALWLNQPSLSVVLPLLSTLMFVSAVADPLVTQLMKAQEYHVLAVRQSIIPVVMGAVGIGLVLLDYGVYALVWGVIAGHVVGCAWLVIVDQRVIRPRWDRKTFFRLFRIGRHVLLQRLAGYLTTNADSFVVGSQLGAGSLGIYRLGNQLAFLLPTVTIAPIGQVIFTDISSNRDHSHLDRRYHQFVYFTGSMMLIYSVLSFLAAPFLVPLLLGQQWMGLVPVVQIFGVVMATGFMSSINADVAKILDFTGVYTRFTIVRSVITLGVIIGAAFFSLKAVIISWVSVGIISNLVNEIIFHRRQKLITWHPGKVGLIALGWLWAAVALTGVKWP